MEFYIGQRVRFIRDSTDGGVEFGAEGDTATIIDWYSKSRGLALINLDKKDYDFKPSAYIVDLAPLTPEDTFEKDGIE